MSLGAPVQPRRRRGACGWALAAALALGACSFAEKPKPTPLEPLTPKIAGKQVWTQRVGPARGLAVVGDQVLVTAQDGDVTAFDALTGKQQWRVAAGARASAAAGSDGRFVASVSQDNELVVIEQGKPRWRTRLESRVVTPPLVAGERVFIQGVDRAITAFDAQDGRRLWSYTRPGDPLALAQPGLLMPFKDTLLVGIGPRLVGLDPLTGSVRTDLAISSPRGTNEVERLADLVAPPARVGDTVCTRAFQSTVACVQAARGTLLWSKNAPGVVGVAADEQVVVGADASDRITAWKLASGDVAWSSERMRHRGLSAPLVAGPTVVFGDSEGWVHFLARDSGEPQLRLRTDGSAVVAAPVKVDTTVIVVTALGSLYAFRPE